MCCVVIEEVCRQLALRDITPNLNDVYEQVGTWYGVISSIFNKLPAKPFLPRSMLYAARHDLVG
jgi:hypothetical protein